MTKRSAAEFAFWAAALAPALFVLTLPAVPLQDGGLHLSSATALQQVAGGEFPTVLQWRPGLPPNLTVEIVLAGLLSVVPPGPALKAVVVAVLVLFALGARSVVSAAGVAGPWAILVLPLAWHRPLAMGFLGFSAALALMLFALAVVVRRPADPPMVPLGLLLLATWLTHIVPALIAFGTCLLVVLAAAMGVRGAGGRPPMAAAGRVALAGAPFALLTAAYVLAAPPTEWNADGRSLLSRIAAVGGGTWGTVSTAPLEWWAYRTYTVITAVFIVVCLVVRVRRQQGWKATDGLLCAGVFLGLAAIVLPDGLSTGGGFLGMRLALIAILLTTTWTATTLGTLPVGTGLHRFGLVFAASAGALAILVPAVRYPIQLETGRVVAEVGELAGCLPRQTTVFQLGLDNGVQLTQAVEPFDEAVGYLAAQRDALDLGNESGWVPYYLWRYREDIRPDQVLGTEPGGLWSLPPRLDFGRAAAAGLSLDSVVVVGRTTANPDVLADAVTQRALEYLQEEFDLVQVSSQGAAELWLRKGLPPSCPAGTRERPP